MQMHSTRLNSLIVAVCITILFIASPTRAYASQPPRATAAPSDTVIRLAGTPRHANPRLVLDLTIGGDNPAQPEANFANVVEVLPLHDGSVLVLDRPLSGPLFLRRFDASGRFIGNIGRVGQGPGEYRRAFGLAQLRNGNIIVGDNGSSIKVYSAAGAPLHDWRIPDVGLMFDTDTSGSLYSNVSFGGETRGTAVLPTTWGVQRISPSGERGDTIILAPLPDLPTHQVVIRKPCSEGPQLCVVASRMIPFHPQALWRWSPLGYFITGVNSSYAIDLRIPRAQNSNSGTAATRAWSPGDPVISIRRNVQPVSISSAERADTRAAITAALQNGDPQWTWTGPDIPAVKPAFSRIFTGMDGRIWVAIAAPSERVPAGELEVRVGGLTQASPLWRQPRLLDVFEPDGTYLGQVRFPFDATPAAMRGDHVWMIAQDGDGVHSARRYRIAW